MKNIIIAVGLAIVLVLFSTEVLHGLTQLLTLPLIQGILVGVVARILFKQKVSSRVVQTVRSFL